MINNDISTISFRSTIAALFLSLMFVLIFLPTGSIFGVNVKVILLAIFLSLFVLYLIDSRQSFSWQETLFILVTAVFLGLWTVNGVLNGAMDVDQVGHQLRDIATTILVAWLTTFFISRQIVRAEALITVIIYAVFALAILKLTFAVMPFIYGIDTIDMIRSIFGESSFVSGDIAFGLFRIQFSADILAPFAMFALLAPSVSGVRFKRVTGWMMFLVILVSSFIAFSRYIWFLLAVAIVAAIIIEQNWKMPVIIALTSLVLAVSFVDFFNTVGEARFLSDAAQISDDVRVDQYKALMDEFLHRPILGAGIGAHSKAVIRDETLSYSYELQWLAFLMQFGVVGMAGLLALIGVSARDLLVASHPAKPWLILLFLLWLASGFTNPYMTSSFSGGTFSLFLALFSRIRNTSPVIPGTVSMRVHPQVN